MDGSGQFLKVIAAAVGKRKEKEKTGGERARGEKND